MKMKTLTKKSLGILLALCMTVSAFPGFAFAAGESGYQLTADWTIHNPADGALEFDGVNQVTFHSQPGELGKVTDAKNVLLYDMPEGDFTATVKVTNTELTSNFQAIGLAAYANPSRVAGTMRRYHSGKGGNVFAKMNYNGNYDESAIKETDKTAPAWLRLERKNNSFVHSYSYDGTNFTEIAATTNNDDLFACEDLKIAVYTGGAQTFDAVMQDFIINDVKISFCEETGISEIPEEEKEYELTKDWFQHNPVTSTFEVNGENKVTFHSQPGELGMVTDAKNVLLYDMPDGNFTATVKVTNTELTSNYQTIGLAAYADPSRVAGTMRRYHKALGGNVFAKMNYNGKYDEKATQDTNKTASAWLRLEREGNSFIHSYSYDGINFTEIAKTTDNDDLFACKDLKIAVYTGGAQTFDAVMEEFSIDGVNILFGRERVPMEIREIAAFEDIYVEYGTSLETLNLADSVRVILEDGTVKELPVEWNEETYHPEIAGVQTVTGTVELEKYVINSAELKAQINIHVMAEGQDIPAAKIVLNRTEATISREGAITLQASVFPDNATDKTVLWESSNAAVATVDTTGKVKATGIGTATITAKSGAATACCLVTVTDEVAIGTVWDAASPNGEVLMTIRLTEEYGLVYEVSANGKTAISENSVLGLKTNTMDTTKDLTFVSSETEEIDETYKVYSGKFADNRNHANQLRLTFKDSTEQYLYSVIVRAYDDGAAFSYELAATGDNKETSTKISDEMSTVNVPDGAVTWSFQYGMAYEKNFERKAMKDLNGTPAIPTLYRTGDTYVLFNEANLMETGDFCGSRFKTNTNSNIFELDFAGEQKNPVSVSLPFTSPWRYAVIGNLETIVKNTMAENLSPAPDEEKYHYSEWVEPGIASWTWLAEGETRDGQRNIEAVKRYVDMAAELGWKYFLWDDGWQLNSGKNEMHPRTQEVIDYAAEKGIGILVWVNEDDINNAQKREERFKIWSEMGIKGIKADFFDGEQETEVAEYKDIYEDLARYRMVGIMHGCNKPTGETRTYPHILSREGIRGDEFINRDQSVQEQLAILPFTRAAVGPSDYTPLLDLPNKHTNVPMGNSDKTIGSQLTIPVLIESGIPCMADRDTSYLREDLRDFFENLPARWDETRFIEGEVGEYVTIARRNGDTWYIVGNTNNTARTMHIDFSDYAEESAEYLAQIWYDGPDDLDKTDIVAEEKVVTEADSMDIKVAKKGGSVIKLTLKTPVHEHNYGEPEWTWTEDFKATAKFVCADDVSHIETAKAVVADEVTKEPTCIAEGEKTYTATVEFNGKTYTDTKTQILDMIPHHLTDGICDNCHKDFNTGNDGNEEHKEHEHTGNGAWVSDTKEHWHICDCGDIVDKALHTPDKNGECTVCHKTGLIPANANETNAASSGTNTGDSVNVLPWILLAFAAVGTATITIIKRKKVK